MDCPIPGAMGVAKTEGVCANGVLILLEALGEDELAAGGLPARPYAPAGSVLERAICRAGFRREQFVLYNAIPTHPPHNHIPPALLDEAIAWGTPYIQDVISRFRPCAILACGNVALKSCCGFTNIMLNRGYPLASRFGIPVIGTLHPSFLRRGAMSYLGVLIHDLRFAVALASGLVKFWSPVLWREVTYSLEEEPYDPPDYTQYASERDADEFSRAVAEHPTQLLAYDIETPFSHSVDEDSSDEPDEHPIISIQFSLRRDSGIFLPWREPFIEHAKRILATGNPKVGANNWRFDDPRLRAAGCAPKGEIHDLRWTWKHFQPDLSGALQFITSFYAPTMRPWKHLAQARPQWYGIRDVDALMRIV